MEREREHAQEANLHRETHLGSSDGSRVAFVGRRREMELFQSSLESAGAGRGRLMLLSGGRGCGKTRTATELAKRAKQQGFGVLWGRCLEGTRLGPWAQILEQYVYGLEESSLGDGSSGAPSDLGKVLPAIRARLEDRSPVGSELSDNVVRLLAEVARRAPQVVVLDDLEDADPDSLAFLRLLARRVDGLPLLILATYCEEGLAAGHRLFDVVLELARVPATDHVDLQGLSPDEIGELVGGRAATEITSRDVSTLRQCTGGNPFFILELLRSLGVAGLRDLSENGLRTLPVPSGVRAVVSRRLQSLSEGCRRGLRVAATIGYIFPASLVAAVAAERTDQPDPPRADRNLESIGAILEEGIGAGVLRPMCKAPGCFGFADWFTMNTLRQEVPVADRAGLQSRITQVIDREGAPIPCLTEWAFRGATSEGREDAASPNLARVCLGHCEDASLFASPPPRFAGQEAAERPAAVTSEPRRCGALREEGDYWTVRFGGMAGQLKESKGLAYLRHLLGHPRRAFLALELVELTSDTSGPEPSARGKEARATLHVFSTSAQPMMDAKAKAACRERLAELREELSEAESHNDLGRVDRLRQEMEQLLYALRQSLGLGGRSRSVSSSATERARSAVTKRIRAEIERIAVVNAELADHLAMTIVTGQVCSYQPERDAEVTWDL